MHQASSARIAMVGVALALIWTGCSRDEGLLGVDYHADTSLQKAPPAGYYDTVDVTTAGSLRATLHDTIDDHFRLPYTSGSTDTWDVLELADQDPGNPGNILDVYGNNSYPKQGGGNTFYNREHTWPKSYGFPNDSSSNYPYSDCHQLFLCDSGYNSSRSNKPFRNCSSSCSEKITVLTNGTGGGSGVYPGNSNWTSGSFTSGTWEAWNGRKGDMARAMFYMDIRYEGGVHGTTGVAEPDLILTDVESLIAASNTGNNESVAYMGMLSVLIQWHQSDPVDDKERARNDAVYIDQGNRNPFIDHPEWADCLFDGACANDTTPPAAPASLVATAGTGSVSLDWADNSETDLAGYNVLRSATSGGAYSQINTNLVIASAYIDIGLTANVEYFYVVSAVDTSANESATSLESSATPQGGGGGFATPWINEFHYDNTGSDTGEFVEVAGSAGTDLNGWTLVGYNGNGGTVYKTVSLSGSFADQANGFGMLSFAFSGLQNGAPDGIALVDDQGSVVEFLSYEGGMTASDGPAAGLNATDVGVTETSGTPVGDSLQLTGTGSSAADFVWSVPSAETSGLPNNGQTFVGGGGDVTPPAPPTLLVATAGDGAVTLDWADNSEPDLAGYSVFRASAMGGPYVAVGGLLVASDYADLSVTNGATYYYVVRAEDDSGNESGDSAEAFATPADTTAPAAPVAVLAAGGDGQVVLNWVANTEPDLAGYNVSRSLSAGGPYTQMNVGLVVRSTYIDTSAVNGTAYYYVVSAQDALGNESVMSSEEAATPKEVTSPPPIWRNLAAAGDTLP